MKEEYLHVYAIKFCIVFFPIFIIKIIILFFIRFFFHSKLIGLIKHMKILQFWIYLIFQLSRDWNKRFAGYIQLHLWLYRAFILYRSFDGNYFAIHFSVNKNKTGIQYKNKNSYLSSCLFSYLSPVVLGWTPTFNEIFNKLPALLQLWK